jgi:hypothetical protein
MSAQSDIIDTAIAANAATGTSLQKLQVDVARSDSAVATRDQHALDADTTAKNDAASVAAASTAISDDLNAVSAAQQVQADALAKLAALAPNSTTTTTIDPNTTTLTTVPPLP